MTEVLVVVESGDHGGVLVHGSDNWGHDAG